MRDILISTRGINNPHRHRPLRSDLQVIYNGPVYMFIRILREQLANRFYLIVFEMRHSDGVVLSTPYSFLIFYSRSNFIIPASSTKEEISMGLSFRLTVTS